MFHIRLIKARSYSGVVSATREKPDVYLNDEATAIAAVATGYFELVKSGGVLESAITLTDDVPPGALEPNENGTYNMYDENGNITGTISQEEYEATENIDTVKQGKTLDEMNKSELETFATYKDVDIKGAKTKADIITKLREALPPEELEGEIVYGSPTMTELQKEITN